MISRKAGLSQKPIGIELKSRNFYVSSIFGHFRREIQMLRTKNFITWSHSLPCGLLTSDIAP